MTFYVVFSIAFVLGRAFLGSTDWVPSGGETVEERLRNELVGASGTTALAEAAGAIEGRVEFSAVEVLPRRDWPVADPSSSPAGMVLLAGQALPDLSGSPAFVGEKFSGSGYVLTVDAGEIAASGEWAPVDSMVLTDPAGRSFFSTHEECSLRLWRAGWTTESLGHGSPHRVVRSTFLGSLRCVDVPEIRSGSLLSFVAAIRYEP